MAIIRCKMCGGELEITDESSICECEFCGTKQTIPTIKDENLQGLFNRANNLRMKAEFDKAAEIYEKIIQADESESEAYWGLILCKYGIEYVEDPATYKRVPTCHRASFEAVTADDDYKKALEYSDTLQKSVYEAEAKAIDEIQKGIVALAQKEDPYDVFICYKETDAEGKRTQDSAIANDIYYQLTQEGFKVFYAAITLEDKLGQEYEPYIFSALNSSKVMLSLGTKPEYFNAVWVKNEWSRFLKIMKKDRSRLLIPCYKGMDAYELPEEFAHLQAQDMGKIGFINDVVRGIKKVISKDSDKPKAVEQVVQQSAGSTSANAQVQRGNMALEDNEWEKAEGFFEEALNLDPQCAEAYLGKLMAKEKSSNVAELTQHYISRYDYAKTEKLEACPEKVDRISEAVSKYEVPVYFPKAEIRKLYIYDRSFMSKYQGRVIEKAEALSELENEKLLVRAKQYADGDSKVAVDKLYEDVTSALDHMINQAKEDDEKKTESVKKSYEKFLDSTDKKVKELYDKAIEKRESDYTTRVSLMNNAKSVDDYEKARALLAGDRMQGYKDTKELAEKCKNEIDRLTEQIAEANAKKEKKKKKNQIISISVVVMAIILIVIGIKVNKELKYRHAIELREQGQCQEASEILTDLGDYKDCVEQIELTEKYDNYYKGIEALNSGDYENAKSYFSMAYDIKDSQEQYENAGRMILQKKYDAAVKLIENKQYDEAYSEFSQLGDFSDAKDQVEKTRTLIFEQKYDEAMKLKDEGKYEEALEELNHCGYVKDSEVQRNQIKEILNEEKYNEAISAISNKQYKKARTLLAELGEYKDSAEKLDGIYELEKEQARDEISIILKAKDDSRVKYGGASYIKLGERSSTIVLLGSKMPMSENSDSFETKCLNAMTLGEQYYVSSCHVGLYTVNKCNDWYICVEVYKNKD